MIDTLFKHIGKKVQLSEEDKLKIQTFFKEKKLRKRQLLLEQGEVCRHLSFISSGLMRTYNVDEKGNEHMSIFGWEGWWLSDFNSFLTGETSVFSIDAIEPSELLMISRADYEDLTLAVPLMDRYFRILYQNSLVTKEKRLLSSIKHTAEEKYLQLADTNPEMLKRVPQNLIASYLGIAPETLSRIRKKLIHSPRG